MKQPVEIETTLDIQAQKICQPDFNSDGAQAARYGDIDFIVLNEINHSWIVVMFINFNELKN